MESTRMDERAGVVAMILTAAASMLVAGLGHMGVGFVLFLAAATPLPPLLAVHARRWVQGGPITLRRRTRE